MSKCSKCGINVADPSQVCPLCNCIVQKDTYTPALPTYPYAEKGIKKIQKALGIYIFAAIVAELIVLTTDILRYRYTGSNLFLSLLLGVFLVYVYVTLKVSVQMSTGYRLKMFMQTLLGIMVVFAIDMLLGYRGWSLNYVLPGAFMFLDLVILVMMIVNKTNWQSYIPLQMLMVALCFVPYVLLHYNITTDHIVCTVALVVTILFFAGTMLIGGKRARDEVHRRFHA